MLLYLMHSEIIYTCKLPKNLNGSFVLSDFNDDGIKRSLLPVFRVDDKWIIKSSDDIKIVFEGNEVEETELKYFNFYRLVLRTGECVILYVNPGFNNDVITRDILNDSVIKISSNATSDVTYNTLETKELDLDISYKNDHIYLKNSNPKVPIYVNNYRFIEGKLDNFDCIFAMGLKFRIVGRTIIFTDDKKGLIINSKNLVNESGKLSIEDIGDNNIIYNNFFNSKDYFYKSPVFKKKINKVNVEISNPDSKEERYHGSIIMEIVPSGLMCLTSVVSGFYTLSNYNKGISDKETLITSLLMCTVLLFVSIVWPFIERFVSFISYNLNEKRRIKTYRKYLKKKKDYLENIYKEQKSIIEFNNNSLNDCLDIIKNGSSLLFSRNIESDDFLTLRLGVGNVPLNVIINYNRPDFTSVNDVLLDDIDKMLDNFKVIKDAPFVFSLSNEKNLAVIGVKDILSNYIDSLLLQLLCFHDSNNLKIVVLTDKSSVTFNSLKNLNYLFDNDREIRFFADNLADAETISSYLYKEYSKRIKLSESSINDINKIKTPYYLIVSDNIEYYKELKIISELLNNNVNLGFSFLLFSSTISNIPEGCTNFINLDTNNATLFKSEMDENSIKEFKPEFIDSNVNLNYFYNKINNMPVKYSIENRKKLPDKYTFLEMFGVGNVDQLNSISRWNNSNIINSLSTPVGIDSSFNILNLDLHETKHGPHGLIAGMTGSGKSEFIITYILSLAVNYSPKEVQFVLIDYKGGGLAGAFENRKTGVKLPHLIGTITNLDSSSMNRSLVSINSELKRRQRLFNEVKETLNTGTIDIYKYQNLYREGKISKSLSHLFIICDEFAELKMNQPDFMDELISIARIGRSLGIHLILSTQKPSGVVDDQIWSNSKFKVCCKVQTTEDSNEMLKKPDAAYLKESGRFYLQVGYDELYMLGQSAYSGSLYEASETIPVNYSKSMDYINNVSNIYKTIDIEVNDKKVNLQSGEELKNVLNYLIECADNIGFKSENLWLEDLPLSISYKELNDKYKYEATKYIINPLIGEYDDPSNQIQGPVHINITNNGNLFVSGITGSGKTTFLQTFIYSSILRYSTDELNFYVVDFLSDSLKMFNDVPQVGNVLGVGDNDKISKLFYFLNNEIQVRKNKLSSFDGTYSNSILHNNVSMSNIIVIINGIDVFKDSFDDLYSEMFIPLSRDGSRYGINFIVTGVSSISLASNVEGNFPQKIGLQFTDNSEYNMLFNNTNGLIPHSNPGRGIVKLDNLYEFQVCNIGKDSDIDKEILFITETLNNHFDKAKNIPIMPRVVSYDSIDDENYTLENVPIGLEIKSNCMYTYNFNNTINSIFYSNYKNIEEFISVFTKIISKTMDTKVVVLDAMGDLKVYSDCKYFDSNFKQVIPALIENVDSKNNDDFTDNIVFIINGYSKLENHLNEARLDDIKVKTITDLINHTKNINNYKFIIFDSINNSHVEKYDWYELFDSSNGILFDIDPDDQNIFDFEDDYNNTKLSRDTCVVIKNYKKKYIKYIRR